MKVMVTGSSGFVGGEVVRTLAADRFDVRATVRSRRPGMPGAMAIGAIDAGTDWSAALNGIECVVHLAARVHVLHERAADPVAEFRTVNVEGTRRLAEAAVGAGVRRFIFLSSIGVHGTGGGLPISEMDPVAPVTPYAASKADAELALRMAAGSAMEVVVLRAPLVYGPTAPGNFARLVSLVSRRVPLPFASVRNERSVLGVANLASAISLAVRSLDAAGEAFLVADSRVVSLPEMIAWIGEGLGRKPALWPVPPGLLRLGARAFGRSREIEQLIGSLTVSTEKIVQMLGWRPPWQTGDAMRLAASSWRR
jgi:nucleoside-diphosphate-sugar epimerase